LYRLDTRKYVTITISKKIKYPNERSSITANFAVNIF